MRKLPDSEQAAFLVDVVERNVRAIVEHVDEVNIEYVKYPSGIALTVYVAPTDVGLVLGTEGATANAIRRILWTACKKTNLRADVDFLTSGPRR